MSHLRRYAAAALAAGTLVAAGCGSDSTATTTTARKPPPKFVILLTNDDGISAPGIDQMAQALKGLSDVELVISAPASNQSGTGAKVTPGKLVTHKTHTVSGIDGTAVDGYPADSVNVALDGGLKPTLVISGINAGQNLGPVTKISGTVGAATTAAQRGYPAVAVSQGIASKPDYPAGAQAVLDYLAKNRADLLAGDAPALVTNINVPTCATGTKIRGTVDTPVATDFNGIDVTAVTCGSKKPTIANDADGFVNGYVTVSEIKP